MDLPSEVQVGPYRYRVDCSEAAGAQAKLEEQSSDTLGNCDHTKQLIRINPDQGADQKADTLLHEVLHAEWNARALHHGPAAKHEEAIVSALATSLLDTLRRNPAFVAYLTATDG